MMIMIKKKSRRELVREAERGRQIQREHLADLPPIQRVEARPDQDGNVELRLLSSAVEPEPVAVGE